MSRRQELGNGWARRWLGHLFHDGANNGQYSLDRRLFDNLQ